MADEIELSQVDEKANAAVDEMVEVRGAGQVEKTGLVGDAEWLKWNKKLADFAKLEKGRDSYGALPPSSIAIKAAGVFLEVLSTNGMNISRLSPSVVGGVAFTFLSGPRMVYVEFRNSGNSHAAFTDDEKDEPEVIKVRQDSSGYSELIAKVKSHLHEQTALSHED